MQFVDVGDDGRRSLRADEALTFISESMPRTVQALITSKIDRLSANQQMILKFASVIGMQFHLGLLVKLLPQEQMTREQIEHDVDVLVSAGILKLAVASSSGKTGGELRQQSSLSSLDSSPGPKDAREYSFVNSFVHDGVYNLMLFAQKRQLHGRIARMIEEEHGGTRTMYPLLAHHAKVSDSPRASERKAILND